MKRKYPKWAQDETEKILYNNILVNIVAPAIVEPKEKFKVKISAVFADRMPLDEAVVIEFIDNDKWHGVPKEIEIGMEPIILENVFIDEPGGYWLCGLLAKEHKVYSSPLLVKENPEYRIYFGDMHIHSVEGTCNTHITKEPSFAYEYIKNVSFLDFAAITDHVYGLSDKKWNSQKKLLRKYDKPGEFVPFLAFESSHSSGYGGDNNAYFSGFDGEWFNDNRNDFRKDRFDIKLNELWQFLEKEEKEFMTIPHHTARELKYRSWDDEYYNPKHEYLYEIYSMWGSSEKRNSRFPLNYYNSEKKAYFEDAIMNGCRFGIIASGDDHTTMPGADVPIGPVGSLKNGSYPNKGYAAVMAKELNRTSLWDSMREKRTYGTTHARSILLFDSEDVYCGSEIEVNKETKSSRKFSIYFQAGMPQRNLVNVSIIRNSRVIYRTEKLSTYKPINIEYIDKECFDNIAIRNAKHSLEPFVAYYVKIDYPDGGAAWSSPIWFIEN